jgi:uncharacterized iron-regulated membrane protein
MNNKMRIYHRYLGFFLVGIMAMYGVSGIVLIFRDTEFLKAERDITKEIGVNLPNEEVGRALRIREFAVESEKDNVVYFKQGTYDRSTGVAQYKVKQLPFVLEKMTKLHKANSSQPLFYLNIFFGLSLFFFVLSSFWMFMPNTGVFRKGMYFAIAGIAFTLLLLFV